MAALSFKLAINSGSFPFLYSAASRGVLIPQLDISNRMPGNFAGTTASQDFNTIQLLFCENILPTVDGLLTVSTSQHLAPITPAETDFDQIFFLRDAQEAVKLFVPARGKNYVYNESLQSWESKNSFVFSSLLSLVTSAYVGGVTYICYEKTKVIKWNATTELFDEVTLALPSGYSISDICGILAASNYLVAYTDTEILWSSLIDPENFADIGGGAGRQTPLDLRGQITCAIPQAGGFVIYTLRNAVAAYFTNTATAPFLFREVRGSGGVASPEQATGDANNNYHFTYGTSGLQQVALDEANTIEPAAADFLRQKSYELWNSVTNNVDYFVLTGETRIKLQFLLNRFLLISYAYAEGIFQLVLVFDAVLNRWGKIRVDHVDCLQLPLELAQPYYTYQALDDLTYQDLDTMTFSYQDLDTGTTLESRLQAAIAFLHPTGRISILVTNPASGTSSAVSLFGHIQALRNRMITVQQVVADSAVAEAIPAVYALSSLDGKTRKNGESLYLYSSTEATVEYLGDITGRNVDIAFTGNYLLTSAIISATLHGKW